MAVCTSQNEDPFLKQDDEPDDDHTDVPDIDLTSGAHFTINLTQPGTLKQKLTNAVFATDNDLVDFLTVKGKMGAADIVYECAVTQPMKRVQSNPKISFRALSPLRPRRTTGFSAS